MLYLTRKVSFDDFIRGELSGDNIKCWTRYNFQINIPDLSLDLFKIIKYYVRVENQISIRYITDCYWLLSNLNLISSLSGLTNMLNISIIFTFYQWSGDKHQQVSRAGEKSISTDYDSVPLFANQSCMLSSNMSVDKSQSVLYGEQ